MIPPAPLLLLFQWITRAWHLPIRYNYKVNLWATVQWTIAARRVIQGGEASKKLSSAHQAGHKSSASSVAPANYTTTRCMVTVFLPTIISYIPWRFPKMRVPPNHPLQCWFSHFFIINHPTIAVPFMGISIQTNPLYSHIFTKYLKIISGHLAALFRQTQQREQESLADLRREPWEYHWNTAKTHQDTKSYCKLGGFVRFNELVLRIFQEHLEESSFFPTQQTPNAGNAKSLN